MSFGDLGLNAIPFFVIPGEAGIQIRDDRLVVFPLSFPPVFPFAFLWIPAFVGMTKGRKRRKV
jgi:hypothetical protein